MNDSSFLFRLFEAALEAARPAGKFRGRLPEPPRGRTIVLGAGKAAASMAAAFEEDWNRPCEGLVVTRYGHDTPTRYVEVMEAGHPVPDASGAEAAARLLALARDAGPDDLVVALVSGGASSLLALPASGVSLAEKQNLTRQLLTSGAPISEMNSFRMALSSVKGGRLAAAAAPARVVTYVISDVPGDDPRLIGSGPTIPQLTNPASALAIAARYGLDLSGSLRAAILANRNEATLTTHEVHIIASPSASLRSAAAVARAEGVTPIILGDRIEGEAREVARVLGGSARSCRSSGMPCHGPAVILSGGETTVTVRGSGRGGRNAEFLLGLFEMIGKENFAAMAADTDGIDGLETNAGAWFDASTHLDVAARSLSVQDHLADNDAFSFFEALGLLVTTGPTRTNVNDFRAIFIPKP